MCKWTKTKKKHTNRLKQIKYPSFESSLYTFKEVWHFMHCFINAAKKQIDKIKKFKTKQKMVNLMIGNENDFRIYCKNEKI